MIVLLYLGAIFTFLGIILIVVGISLRNKDKKKNISCTGRTTGTVVRIVERRESDMDGGYFVSFSPMIRYFANGLEYEKPNDVYNARCNYAIGQNVEILYDPANPAVMIIAGDKTMKLIYTVFLIIGIFFTILGIGLLVGGPLFAI